MSIDKEKAKRNLEAILGKAYSNDTDILKLKDYHKIYRKEVSLFKRSWAAAWLFMYYDQKETPAAARPAITRNAAPPRSQSAKTPSSEEKPSSPVEVVLPEEESKKLFISIGKNRRLFPRDIITLIMSKTSAAREDVGVIKILDNYSFVQVRDTRTEEIIKALNGLKFRGRSLTVNYAKPKNSENSEE
ncbi:MAG: DbpA RNA binding domain-containing protein [Treponema sp.]|jgi:hypothetical protein|nr:DbpA RNA binding domain-containing protein [Treponema sp.]